MDWTLTTEQLPKPGAKVLVWVEDDDDADNLGMMSLEEDGNWYNADVACQTQISYGVQDAPLYWSYIKDPIPAKGYFFGVC